MKIALVLFVTTCLVAGQRITTIQLDGVQYFVSRMNPYSPELNYFLAYQYCRSLGLQLASFETKEKADTMTQYLKNAGYTKYDFWISGNKLGTDMLLWLSTGLPFNSTFDYMARRANRPADVPPGTEPQRVARESDASGSSDACVAMVAPTLAWDSQDCSLVKDFICEQTRCYYYNYGSIPVSATQGNRRPYATTTTVPETDRDDADRLDTSPTNDEITEPKSDDHEQPENTEVSSEASAISEDPVVGRLMSTLSSSSQKKDELLPVEKTTRPEDIPNITSLFTKGPGGQTRIETLFEGLETHEIRSLQRKNQEKIAEHPESPDYENIDMQTEMPDNALEDAKTIGPYDSNQDYVNDQPETLTGHDTSKGQEEDASTILPDAEPAYRYNIKVRSNGKVLDPPSK
ncbi:uncharacterized protein LOC135172540 isoform X1 [Diachasmimorpha longicaudata]|uniref:uncharacterized protein LOC135172540 isoform X1 n=2 Tax=Diachasmimorpha longicaudata TaxID=58733 RepID=UPI0030B8D708